MTAQEALDEIKELLSVVECEDDNYQMRFYDAGERLTVLQQLIDQSNAKPKTLEELGWEIAYFDKESVCYFKMTGELELSVELTRTYCSVNSFDEFLNQHGSLLTYEEILAIAEKMKELGMTNE